MFSFFKKKPKATVDTAKLLSDFESNISLEEKGAILASILSIATINFKQNLHKSETDFLDKVSNLLNISFSQSSELANGILKKGGQYAVSIINNLSDKDKDWYVGIVHSLIHLRGNPSEEKRKFAFGIFAAIGVDGKRYISVLELMKQLS